MLTTNSGYHRVPHRDRRNTDALLRVGLVLALSLFLASHYPVEVIAALTRSMLLLAAVINAGIAALKHEPVLAPHLTRWDEAAALWGFGLLAGFFVDPAAVAALAGGAAPAGVAG